MRFNRRRSITQNIVPRETLMWLTAQKIARYKNLDTA